MIKRVRFENVELKLRGRGNTALYSSNTFSGSRVYKVVEGDREKGTKKSVRKKRSVGEKSVCRVYLKEEGRENNHEEI